MAVAVISTWCVFSDIVDISRFVQRIISFKYCREITPIFWTCCDIMKFSRLFAENRFE